MRSLTALVARWQWVGAEPVHGSQATTRAGDAAKYAAVRDTAEELAQAIAGGRTSAAAVAELVDSLRKRSRAAQAEAGSAEESLGRSAAYAWCATDLEQFASAGHQ